LRSTSAGWGYGGELIALLRSMEEVEPGGTLDRLAASHPAIASRIARLEPSGLVAGGPDAVTATTKSPIAG